MSDANYKVHPIRSTIEQIFALDGDEELFNVPTPLSEEQQWQLDRVFEVARVIEGYLDQTPSTLVSMPYLSNVQVGMNEVLTQISGFRANKNVGHLANASDQIDRSVLPHMQNAFGVAPKVSASGKLGEIIDDTRSRSQNAIMALEKEKEALGQQIVALTAQVTAQDLRLSELTLAVETQKKEAVAVTAVVTGEYAKTDQELRALFKTSAEAMASEYKDFQKVTLVAAETHLQVLADKESEAKKIVQVVGNIGVTGNYQKIAQLESAVADNWRYATIGFFGTGVALAIIAFVVHLLQGSNPENGWTFAMRFVTAIAIAAPAFYTARESARHRTNADRARQRELELASLGPFIEMMPPDQKDSIRSKLVERYFGSPVESHDAKQPFDTKDAIELVKVTMDGAVKIAKT